jgi:RimJ/RimL family protein N-acetyltransferase
MCLSVFFAGQWMSSFASETLQDFNHCRKGTLLVEKVQIGKNMTFLVSVCRSQEMNLSFRRFSEQDLRLVTTWFVDPEMKRRISYPTTQWFNYVSTTPNVYAWMILERITPIAYVQVDIEDDQRAYTVLAVKAEFRGQGYCKKILRALVKRPEVSKLSSIEGYVEVDNTASQRCLIAAGFHQINETPDEDGMFKFVYSRSEY